jgi:hypothetical protein
LWRKMERERVGEMVREQRSGVGVPLISSAARGRGHGVDTGGDTATAA